jgi:DNA-binding IclR family transcriptional regulator
MEAINQQHASARIQIEFIETPSLKLTLAQAARLCDLPRDVCDAAVSSLVTDGFLWQAGDGRYLRRGLVRQADAILGPQSLARAS